MNDYERDTGEAQSTEDVARAARWLGGIGLGGDHHAQQLAAQFVEVRREALQEKLRSGEACPEPHTTWMCSACGWRREADQRAKERLSSLAVPSSCSDLPDSDIGRPVLVRGHLTMLEGGEAFVTLLTGEVVRVLREHVQRSDQFTRPDGGKP